MFFCYDLEMPDNPTSASRIKEYLGLLAQCAYNTKIIIDIHSTKKPGYFKTLEHFYDMERKELFKLLNNSPEGIDTITFENSVIRADLLNGNGDTEEEIKNSQLASKNIASLLKKITAGRIANDPKFKLTQGVEDGLLKRHLLYLIDYCDKYFQRGLIEEYEIHPAQGKDRSRMRYAPINRPDIIILEIEKIEEGARPKNLKIYINRHYRDPLFIKNGIYGKKLYELAEKQKTKLVKGFLEHYTEHDNNKLFSSGRWKKTKLLQQKNYFIIPEDDIQIRLVDPIWVTGIIRKQA